MALAVLIFSEGFDPDVLYLHSAVQCGQEVKFNLTLQR